MKNQSGKQYVKELVSGSLPGALGPTRPVRGGVGKKRVTEQVCI